LLSDHQEIANRILSDISTKHDGLLREVERSKAAQELYTSNSAEGLALAKEQVERDKLIHASIDEMRDAMMKMVKVNIRIVPPRKGSPNREP
jgi:hypothetical protein